MLLLINPAPISEVCAATVQGFRGTDFGVYCSIFIDSDILRSGIVLTDLPGQYYTA